MENKNPKIALDTEILNKMWSYSLDECLISHSHSKDLSNFESKEADHNVSSATIEKTNQKKTNSTAENVLPISENSFDKNSVFINKVYSKDDKVSRILAYGKAIFYIGTGISAVLHGIAKILEVLK